MQVQHIRMSYISKLLGFFSLLPMALFETVRNVRLSFSSATVGGRVKALCRIQRIDLFLGFLSFWVHFVLIKMKRVMLTDTFLF